MSGFQQLSQTSGYRSPNAQQRTLSIINMSDEEIPGFAACVLWPGSAFPSESRGNTMPRFNQEVVGGQVVWHVYKPNAKTSGNLAPEMIIINGPTSIPSGGTGTGSQDWPLQVTHELSDDLSAGETCGIVDGQWDVNSNGNDFVCTSSDKAVVLGDTARQVIWVSPAHSERVYSITSLVFDSEDNLGASIPDGGLVQFNGITGSVTTSGGAVLPGVKLLFIDDGQTKLGPGSSVAHNTVVVPVSGFYECTISASVSKPGILGRSGLIDLLAVRVRKTGDGVDLLDSLTDGMPISDVSTPGISVLATRENAYFDTIEGTGVSLFYPHESVCASGTVFLEKGDGVSVGLGTLRSLGGPTFVSNPRLSLRLSSPENAPIHTIE